MWLKIEAIGTFEDPENIKVLTPKLFDFFTNELNIEQVNNLCSLIFRVYYNSPTGSHLDELLPNICNTYWKEWENSGSIEGMRILFSATVISMQIFVCFLSFEKSKCNIHTVNCAYSHHKNANSLPN